MKKKEFLLGLVVFVLLVAGVISLYSGIPFSCLEDNCGAGCIYGKCADASSCGACIIDHCLNDETGERESYPCSYMEP